VHDAQYFTPAILHDAQSINLKNLHDAQSIDRLSVRAGAAQGGANARMEYIRGLRAL
jgi:hypothetical protein